MVFCYQLESCCSVTNLVNENGDASLLLCKLADLTDATVEYKRSFSGIPRQAKKPKHPTFSLFSVYEISQTHFHKRSVVCVFFKVRGAAALTPWLPLQVLSIAMAPWKWSYFMSSLWGSFQRKAASAENGYRLYTAWYTLSNLYKLLPSFSSSALSTRLWSCVTNGNYNGRFSSKWRESETARSRDTPNALLGHNYLQAVCQTSVNSRDSMSKFYIEHNT